MNAQAQSATAPTVYQFNPTFRVRVLVIDNEPWFCLSDVCKILEVDRGSNLVKSLDKKGWAKNPTLTEGGNQDLVFISEPNLYRIIFRSNKAEAKNFQDWVFNDVLPAIRKNGSYAKPHPQAALETINANDYQNISSIVADIAKWMRFQKSWTCGAWYAIRQSTQKPSPNKFNINDLPIIAEELERILNAALKLRDYTHNLEREVIKTVIRERGDIDAIIAREEAAFSATLNVLTDNTHKILYSWHLTHQENLIARNTPLYPVDYSEYHEQNT